MEIKVIDRDNARISRRTKKCWEVRLLSERMMRLPIKIPGDMRIMKNKNNG